MATNKVHASEIADSIRPGVIYLTKGTTQQIKSILPEHVVIRHYYNPTTTTFREWLLPNLFSHETIARVIYYPEVVGTGRIKDTKRTPKSNYGSVQNNSNYAIPNDQTVIVPKGSYFFILLTNPHTGELNDKTNLEGEYIEELDLRHVIFNEVLQQKDNLPLTTKLLNSVTNPLLLDILCEEVIEDRYSSWFGEVNPYIIALTTEKATSTWYMLGGKGVYYKYFLVNTKPKKKKDQVVPLILAGARAWCLHPYLAQFINRIKQNEVTAPMYLTQFATWVFLTCTTYANPGANGLYWYEPRSSKTLGYWVFRPSKEAKLALASFLEER
jgi:hypothetical protein